MKKITVIQHTSAEYLGLIEDHLEGRRIRFQYHRPFTEQGTIPASDIGDGLIILGGGPWGAGGSRDVPTLAQEVALTRSCYMSGLPIVGIGLGAQIVSLACDGSVTPAPLQLKIGEMKRTDVGALNGFLPETAPHVVYMRDRPAPPAFAKTLAVDTDGESAIFQIGEKVFGFTGHPGVKRAMVEDLIMEFEEAPKDPGPALDAIGSMKSHIEESLISIMTGLIQKTGLMRD
jgi:GMP synthase-like glutamine amidotransferase